MIDNYIDKLRCLISYELNVKSSEVKLVNNVIPEDFVSELYYEIDIGETYKFSCVDLFAINDSLKMQQIPLLSSKTHFDSETNFKVIAIYATYKDIVKQLNDNDIFIVMYHTCHSGEEKSKSVTIYPVPNRKEYIETLKSSDTIRWTTWIKRINSYNEHITANYITKLKAAISSNLHIDSELIKIKYKPLPENFNSGDSYKMKYDYFEVNSISKVYAVSFDFKIRELELLSKSPKYRNGDKKVIIAEEATYEDVMKQINEDDIFIISYFKYIAIEDGITSAELDVNCFLTPAFNERLMNK
jgi:hypothetical protein